MSLEMAPPGTTRSSSSFSARRGSSSGHNGHDGHDLAMTDMATAEAKHLDRKHVVFGEIVREDGQVGEMLGLPSGKHTKSYGKSSFFNGKIN